MIVIWCHMVCLTAVEKVLQSVFKCESYIHIISNNFIDVSHMYSLFKYLKGVKHEHVVTEKMIMYIL